MSGKELFESLSNIYLSLTDEQISLDTDKRMDNILQELDRIDPTGEKFSFDDAIIILINITKVACGIDGVLQQNERVLIELAFDWIEEDYDIDKVIELIRDSKITHDEIDVVEELCQLSVKMCANILCLMMDFMAVDGRINSGEDYLINNVFPIFADGYSASEIVDAM